MFRSHLSVAGLAAGVLGFFALVAVPGCGSKSDDLWPASRSGPRVLVSFAPYYCFAANVAGEDAVVKSLMTTSGPHHFDPTDRDAIVLRRADLFFINGLGLEGEMPETLKKGSGNAGLKIIDLGSKIPAGMLCEGHDDDDDHDQDAKKDSKDGKHDKGEKHEAHDHHDHHHGPHDPHIWLSPDHAEIVVNAIRDELKVKDPVHAENYDHRAAEYVAKLRAIKTEGIAMLKDKKDRRMVTFHESLPYFAKTFDLQIVGVVEKTPGVEPTFKQTEEIIKLCANPEHPVRLITVEPQYGNSNSGQQLIKELVNRKVPDPVLVEFDTLETVVPDQLTPDWYEKKMMANLKALAEKMK